MTVVVDTNVLVSGLLSPIGPPGEIVRLIASGHLEVSYDARLLAEYHAVLARPKLKLHQGQVRSLLEQLKTRGRLVSAVPSALTFPDDDDRPFAEVAEASGAAHLVTGNSRHYPHKHYGTARVVSPAAFVDEMRAASSR